MFCTRTRWISPQSTFQQTRLLQGRVGWGLDHPAPVESVPASPSHSMILGLILSLKPKYFNEKPPPALRPSMPVTNQGGNQGKSHQSSPDLLPSPPPLLGDLLNFPPSPFMAEGFWGISDPLKHLGLSKPGHICCSSHPSSSSHACGVSLPGFAQDPNDPELSCLEVELFPSLVGSIQL